MILKYSVDVFFCRLKSDRSRLGEMLLCDVPTSDRLFCALVIRVEERDLLQVR